MRQGAEPWIVAGYMTLWNLSIIAPCRAVAGRGGVLTASILLGNQDAARCRYQVIVLPIACIGEMHGSVLYLQIAVDQQRRFDWSRSSLILIGIWMAVWKQPGIVTFARLRTGDVFQVDLHTISNSLRCPVPGLSATCIVGIPYDIACYCCLRVVAEYEVRAQASTKQYENKDWNQYSI